METSTIQIKVRGYHLDLYGHVNNARYLEFLEEARWTHYEGRVSKEEFESNRWAFVVVNININYRHPATVGDVIRIETGIKNAGKRSIVMQQRIFLNDTDTLVVEADVTYVIVDGNTNSAIPIDGRLREILVGE
ncbi:MAG: thioesterase family protein [Bacteroidota bacterium]